MPADEALLAYDHHDTTTKVKLPKQTVFLTVPLGATMYIDDLVLHHHDSEIEIMNAFLGHNVSVDLSLLQQLAAEGTQMVKFILNSTGRNSQQGPSYNIRLAHPDRWKRACQTDPPTTTCSIGTQLSMKTLQPHFISTGTQTNFPSNDVGVGTAAALPFLTTPIKRRRTELEVGEEEEPAEGSSVAIKVPHDSTYDPVDTLNESADVRKESSVPVHKTPTYIVYEDCLMERFQMCPVCKRNYDVRSRRLDTFLSVEQQCLHCEFSRKWNTQPLVGSTPAGNLQLSTAVYTTSASFFKIEKVLYLDIFRNKCNGIQHMLSLI
ncbi:uncharacterized protein LOC131465734 [Solea solea]|uniref:uncharacterized protein LOC131465734 n=1 Tax=Solea solea TaxID=90069 RepID=UPI002729922C|nr:uncharacterized protein LOC131465734 [Solea solea]